MAAMQTHLQKSNGQKWHHLHNSFLLMEENPVGIPLTPTAIQHTLTPDQLDGLVIFRKNNNDLKGLEMKEFFNNDGSRAKYCGNAHICLATLAYGWGVSETKFGEFRIKTTSEVPPLLTFKLTPFKWKNRSCKPISLPHGLKKNAFQIAFGVPHIVISETVSSRKKILDYQKYSRPTLLQIQNDPRFPEGTNITFVFIDTQGHPQGSVSFERGLKKFSAACSSGIFASIVSCLQQGLIKPEEPFTWETQHDPVKLKVTHDALVIYSRAHPIGD